MLLFRICAPKWNSSSSVALYESLVQMGSTKSNTNTDRWDNMLIHQAIRAQAGWGYLQSCLIWFLTNYEQAGNATELPVLAAGWMLFASSKKTITLKLLNLYLVHWKSFGSVLMMTCCWLPGYNFSFKTKKKSDCNSFHWPRTVFFHTQFFFSNGNHDSHS